MGHNHGHLCRRGGGDECCGHGTADGTELGEGLHRCQGSGGDGLGNVDHHVGVGILLLDVELLLLVLLLYLLAFLGIIACHGELLLVVGIQLGEFGVLQGAHEVGGLGQDAVHLAGGLGGVVDLGL